MATTITEGYVYIVKNGVSISGDTIANSEGATVVKILTGGSAIWNIANDIFFKYGYDTRSVDEGGPDAQIMNLNKVKEAITITGLLLSVHNGVAESVNAITKLNNLRNIAKSKQPSQIVWGVDANSNQLISKLFNINKVQFKLVPDAAYSTTYQKIEVTVQGLLGASLGSSS